MRKTAATKAAEDTATAVKAPAKPKATAKAKAPAKQKLTAEEAVAAQLALALQVLDDGKAEDIVNLDLIGKTSLADAMVVASGRSDRHVGALAERMISALKDAKFGAPRVEGMPVCDWVLIDTGDIIVHLFRPEVRAFYNLEKLWGMSRPVEGEAEAPKDEKPKTEKPKRPRTIVAESATKGAEKPGRKPAARRKPSSSKPASGA